jgi:urease accessory protein
LKTLDVNTLRLWQLISPTLPIGAYAYSTGLEYAVEAGWVKDEESARNWLLGQLRNSFPALDIPLFFRMYIAWNNNDANAVQLWNQQLLAMRESAELRQEDLALGAALLRVLPGLNITPPARAHNKMTYCCVFAFAAQNIGVEKKQAAQGLLWSWCENQVAAMMKLMPLGQSSGQRILSAAIPLVATAVEQGMHCEDENVGVLMPGLAIASALHETQYSRLFRS